MTRAALGPNTSTCQGKMRLATAAATASGSDEVAQEEDEANCLALERLHLRVTNFAIALGGLALVGLAIKQFFFLNQ